MFFRTIFYKKITDNNPYNDFKNISINESLNQKDKSYYLYYFKYILPLQSQKQRPHGEVAQLVRAHDS